MDNTRDVEWLVALERHIEDSPDKPRADKLSFVRSVMELLDKPEADRRIALGLLSPEERAAVSGYLRDELFASWPVESAEPWLTEDDMMTMLGEGNGVLSHLCGRGRQPALLLALSCAAVKANPALVAKALFAAIVRQGDIDGEPLTDDALDGGEAVVTVCERHMRAWRPDSRASPEVVSLDEEHRQMVEEGETFDDPYGFRQEALAPESDGRTDEESDTDSHG